MSMRRYDIGLTLVASVLSIVSAGCVATRTWTNELIAKQEVEIDERFEKVETGVREHEERLDRVEVRVGQLDTGLSEARALLRASLPQAARPVTPRTPPPAPTPPPAARRTLIGVVHVPFAFDRADLDASAEAALGMILKELREHPHMTIDLEGTTDPVGSRDYNVKLSQRRVETVRRWLVDKGVDRTRIVGSAGRGPLVDVAVQNNLKRRVVVKLMRES
jgi:outer membrane protein OmpA-like peptidoglycan-associated protein